MDIDTLIDCCDAAFHILQKSKYQNTKEQLNKLGTVVFSERRIRITDFEILARIAKGAFGAVFAAKYKKNRSSNLDCNKLYAIKRILRSTIQKQPNATLLISERNILLSKAEWLVKAHSIFQDSDSVYFVMDFVMGGDFMNFLTSRKITEEDVRFYGAELVAAVEEIHRMGYVHRDLKPENILMEADGHIKIADFGSSTRIKLAENKVVNESVENYLSRRRGSTEDNNIMVGTPDYVSPEVLENTGSSSSSIDLWTLGVIFYEMIYEEPPFYSESLEETYDKIPKISTNINIKEDEETSPEFKDLLSKLICRKEVRIVLDEIKTHPFFKGTDWNNLRMREAPFKPNVGDEDFLSCFSEKEMNAKIKEEDEDSMFKPTEVDYLNCVGVGYQPYYGRFLLDELKSRAEDDKNSGTKPENEANNDNMEIKTNNYAHNNGTCDEADKVKSENAGKIVETEPLIVEGNHVKTGEHLFNTLEKPSITDELTPNIEETSSNVEKRPFVGKKGQPINKISSFQENKDSYTKYSAQNTEMIDANGEFQNNLPIDNKNGNGRTDIEALIKKFNIESFVKKERQETARLHEIKCPLNTITLIVSDIRTEVETLERQFKEFGEVKKYQTDSLIKTLNDLANENKIVKQYKKTEIHQLKKDLRIKKTEVKEYQSRLELELCNKVKLEEEIAFLRKELIKYKKNDRSIKFKVVYNNSDVLIVIENLIFKFLNYESSVSNVFVRTLKQNELFHLAKKERNLTLCITIVEEIRQNTPIKSDAKMMKEDLKKEELIREGIKKIMEVSGESKDGLLQLEGSTKRIEYLKNEIKKYRKLTGIKVESVNDTISDVDNSTPTSSQSPAPQVKIYDYNNHVFKSSTFKLPTFCDHCDDILRGVVEQGLLCPDCGMTVHKNCYVLSDISCELFNAIKKGSQYYITMRNLEEKERLVGMIKSQNRIL